MWTQAGLAQAIFAFYVKFRINVSKRQNIQKGALDIDCVITGNIDIINNHVCTPKEYNYK